MEEEEEPSRTLYANSLMALQGRALYRTCVAAWRVSGPGRSAAFVASSRKELVSIRSSCMLHRWLSSESHQQHSTTTPVCLPSITHASVQQAAVAEGKERLTGIPTAKTTQELDQLCANLTTLRLCLQNVDSVGKFGSAFCLSSWPSAEHLEYVCPSETLTVSPELVILEQMPNLVTYELPHTRITSLVIDPTPYSTEISEPTNSSSTNAPKEARRIQKIRRKKMKRHQLKKFRKRMAFALRKMRRERRKKKEEVFEARLAGIKQWGETFSAEDWLQEELNKARRGGFYINIMDKSR